MQITCSTFWKFYWKGSTKLENVIIYCKWHNLTKVQASGSEIPSFSALWTRPDHHLVAKHKVQIIWKENTIVEILKYYIISIFLLNYLLVMPEVFLQMLWHNGTSVQKVNVVAQKPLKEQFQLCNVTIQDKKRATC